MTDFRFVYLPADNRGVDPEYKLIGKDTVSVQDATAYGGGYVVNEWREEEEAMYHHGVFRRLSDAQAKAIEVANI